MARTIKSKRAGFGLEVKTFKGQTGNYIVFKLPSGAFHVFVETEAKAAAKDCGAALKGKPNTREFWRELWDQD